ncbi:hypothetical protein HYQ09_gp167 [Acinetobacter phage vB_AbaM_Konradin]|uniref:Uncharacterized protein n=3 Tax=Lazarusvirus TaxID=2842820 RepID=A0A650EV52_9CAUD|nr:hypothetical protein HYQ09_gp167 [Acinetobacter phage vB_AbaM_Konradin]YP_009886995.1 hypothetical protein HYQ23_gp166 [Acinetobacter phage vB_AbaM_Lazarus]QGT53987.1 hypothetical protein Konradin_224 [Acinetobacter phage vB_AbaM_Konradin]QHJ74158.1 hypothetical protein Lazarus_223 [Acinetobacter phage vB_AbaM_Lazarus]
MKQLKHLWQFKALFLAMSEFWFLGLPIAGAIAALVYIATHGSNTLALVGFFVAASVYFLIEFTEARDKMK